MSVSVCLWLKISYLLLTASQFDTLFTYKKTQQYQEVFIHSGQPGITGLSKSKRD